MCALKYYILTVQQFLAVTVQKKCNSTPMQNIKPIFILLKGTAKI
jgi:hypothetical protein